MSRDADDDEPDPTAGAGEHQEEREPAPDPLGAEGLVPREVGGAQTGAEPKFEVRGHLAFNRRVTSGTDGGEVTVGMTTGVTVKGRPPDWLWGALVLFFFMLLVVAAVFGHEVPAGARSIVRVVLALGMGMSWAMFGGSAKVKAIVPWPGNASTKREPFKIRAVDGGAMFVVIFVVTYWFF